MKKITQYRYGNVTDPNITDSTTLTSGSLFVGKDIYRLGIQTMPGVKFYLQDDVQPIIIGNTGIFEIDLINESTEINALKFDGSSITMLDNNQGSYLIIDIIYEEVSE